jgi:protein-disulfide isomerase
MIGKYAYSHDSEFIGTVIGFATVHDKLTAVPLDKEFYVLEISPYMEVGKRGNDYSFTYNNTCVLPKSLVVLKDKIENLKCKICTEEFKPTKAQIKINQLDYCRVCHYNLIKVSVVKNFLDFNSLLAVMEKANDPS